MFVTYAGDAGTRFDRDYWIDVHLPLVKESWGPHGLASTAGFFPPGDGGGLLAIATCLFRDEAALRTALASAETERVTADVARFTTAVPQRSIGRPF